MVNVVVGGLPKAVKVHKFLSFLKKVVFRAPREFHVNYTKSMMNGTKLVSLTMKSNDANKALRFLCDYQYLHANQPYTLQCWIEDGRGGQDDDMFYNDVDEPMRREHRVIDDYEPPRKNRRFSKSPMRSGSRSPYPSHELRDIEIKIDLVRKQRILMEEQTKLLLEKRKLEYLQNIGPNDYAQLAKFDDICKRNDPNEVSDFVETLPSKMPKKKPMAGGKLPNFLGPCKEITSQMHEMIRSHADINEDNRAILWKLLRSTLKKRLAIILEDKKYMSTTQIVDLYRSKHPKTSDKALVDELLNTISTSCWPKKAKGTKVETAKANIEGQTNESENPGADAKELPEATQVDNAKQPEDDVDEFDENDVENWEDDVKESKDDSAEPSKDDDKVYQPGMGDDDLVAEKDNPDGEKDSEGIIEGDDIEKSGNVTVDEGDVEEVGDNDAGKQETEEVEKEIVAQ